MEYVLAGRGRSRRENNRTRKRPGVVLLQADVVVSLLADEAVKAKKPQCIRICNLLDCLLNFNELRRSRLQPFGPSSILPYF